MIAGSILPRISISSADPSGMSDWLTYPIAMGYCSVGENEPLVILYVALTREIADSVDHLIRDEHEPPIERPTTAIFYSISSRGNSIGLSQVDLGNHMIRTG